ncbi:MAG TPA: YqgE/AlgH family protein [Terriglobia bacterium]|nr:YqgE/AlgH family protein [Terriglobia bacterium]
MVAKFWAPVAFAATVLCGTVIASGQSTGVKDLGVGKLLVASRNLSDPNFAESVVLLIQCDKQGTVGLMINRRTQAPVSRIIQNLDTGKHGSDPIYIGGPVGMTQVFGLFRSAKKPDEGTSVLSEVYLISTKALLEKTVAATPGPSDLRLYLGYCGWAAGQLENEVRRGGWWIFDANARVVFDPNPGSVWSRLIARTERQMVENGVIWDPFTVSVRVQ